MQRAQRHVQAARSDCQRNRGNSSASAVTRTRPPAGGSSRRLSQVAATVAIRPTTTLAGFAL